MKTKTATALGIKYLYHYQSFDEPERLARIFTDRTLFFSKPRNFNDPWDCRPFFNKTALNDPVYYTRTVDWFIHCSRTRNTALPEHEQLRREQELRSNRQLLEWMIDQMTADMELAIQEQYRIYCLSTHPDSVLMWAHYAACCRGVCLEFSVDNELFSGALRVTYLKSYPQFDVNSTEADENLLPLLSKSDVWSYEDEFRVIATEQPFIFPDVPTTTGNLLALPKGSLQSVIIGTEMPASDREVVKTLVTASGWNTTLKIARLVPDRYELEIVNLNS